MPAANLPKTARMCNTSSNKELVRLIIEFLLCQVMGELLVLVPTEIWIVQSGSLSDLIIRLFLRYPKKKIMMGELDLTI